MRILLLSCLMMLTACVAPQNPGNMKSADPPPPMPVVDNSIKPAPTVAVEDKTNNKTGEIDFSCKSDSDCKIKDVGSCCGYRPSCVNKDSKTFPEQVKAECAKNDMAGICGFPSISSCTCTNNKCEGVAEGSAEGQIQ